MNKLLAILMLLGSLLFPANATDFSKQYAKTVDSVVEIVGEIDKEKSTGIVYATGWFFEDRHILTSAHTFWEAGTPKKIQVCGNELNDICAEAHIVYLDKQHDIAILEISLEDWEIMSQEEHIVTVPVSNEIMQAGEEIYGIGNRFGFLFHFYAGNVEMPYKFDAEGSGISYIDAELFSGDSGGPIFNEKGEVIGIAKEFVIPDEKSEHIEAMTTNIQLRKAIKDWKNNGGPFNIIDASGAHWLYNDQFQLVIVEMEYITFFDKFGLEKDDYDLYVTIQGVYSTRIRNADELVIVTSMMAVGDAVTIDWYRNGQKMSKTLVIDPTFTTVIPETKTTKKKRG